MALISHKTDGLQSIEMELDKHGIFQVIKSCIFKKKSETEKQDAKEE